ncbi:hypothetical protein CPC735_064260 [Coccidioides posadasii C735 delta SOWgp]|uniref:Uncharacterized protein n=3 Tax=Coccidioides posadasii TaxID=199306 RepID=E9D774_COCPS|nr:hypothetical protein CPC735_064260 [Coccidioides posadasii C735 delta SOWgp]EER28553.1 hypothetical protein CPC735_064260 [Coccidioides posadasii C735 delta SOWgp]EFW17733.1 conserved hypothetical protein [Coccidioides posadasii str. Silveira]KMM68434.1 hypothetical protein CPAG_04761 [Coccidioides posadasii RMSCC 3488]|eukprot:XP_003070698.1 hypothetical protein CPC735_064260 [Coccidioides posadasii C735 delta SOWgp]
MAGSTLILPTTDVRYTATQSKRDHDQKAKWARGSRPGMGQPWEGYTTVRPVLPLAKSKVDRKAHIVTLKRQAIPSKNPRSHLRSVYYEDMREASDLSDTLDDMGSGPSPSSPAGDVDVFYSFDARTGPRAGEHLLSVALERAVERFETKETEKLVREYDFVDERESTDGGYAANDDDYEFIDRATL